MNKITFCSEPDILPGPSYALKNFSNDTIKHLLNVCSQNTQFYLIEDTSSTEWREQIQKTIADIISNNKIDILINNAGITGPTAELWNYNIKDWNSIIDINLHGTFYCCKLIVPVVATSAKAFSFKC